MNVRAIAMVVVAVSMGLFIILFPASIKTAIADENDVAEKQITFYTTYGYRQEQEWSIPLRIWVSEQPDKLRRLAVRGGRKIVKKIAGLEDLTEHQKQLYRSRSKDFFADSKSRQHVEFRFKNDPLHESFSVGHKKTDRNGLLEGAITLSAERVQQLLSVQQSGDGWLDFTATSKDHAGAGRVRMLEPAGLSVISDVDDTIKVTEIPAGERVVMQNTFFKDYRAAPCMASLYQSFGTATAFHYVSGGPWQMYASLHDFLFDGKTGFPQGSFHMKNVRTNPFESESYRDFQKLIAGSATVEQKTQQIETLLAHFPQRQFILIGDSGEHDPEIFNAIRLQHPLQIREIRIRDVVNARQLQPARLEGMVVIASEQGSDTACQ